MGNLQSKVKSVQEKGMKIEASIDKLGDHFENLDNMITEKFVKFNSQLDSLQGIVMEQIAAHRRGHNKKLSLQESTISLWKSVNAAHRETPNTPSRRFQPNPFRALQHIKNWSAMNECVQSVSYLLQTPPDIHLRVSPTLLLESRTTGQAELLSSTPWVYVGHWSITRPVHEIKAPTKVVGSEGSGQNQFRYPFNITLHPINGRIYVADSENNRVVILTSSFSPFLIITQPSPGSRPFQDPRGVGISPDGSLIVIVECVGKQIHLLDMNHNLIRSINQLPANIVKATTSLYYPYYAVFDRHSNFYVSDRANDRVLKFDRNGNLLRQIGEPSSPRPAASVLGILVNDDGLLLTYPQSGNVLRVYSLDGEFKYEKMLAETRDFNSLARGPDGGFLICDCSASRIVFYDRNCCEIHQVHVRGVLGAVYAPDGRLFAATGYQSHSIQIF